VSRFLVSVYKTSLPQVGTTNKQVEERQVLAQPKPGITRSEQPSMSPSQAFSSIIQLAGCQRPGNVGRPPAWRRWAGAHASFPGPFQFPRAARPAGGGEANKPSDARRPAVTIPGAIVFVSGGKRTTTRACGGERGRVNPIWISIAGSLCSYAPDALNCCCGPCGRTGRANPANSALPPLPVLHVHGEVLR
jgi:hypothetical protein